MAVLTYDRRTARAFVTANPVLAEGTVGIERDKGRSKVGDGTTNWVDLPYQDGGPDSDAFVDRVVTFYFSGTQTAAAKAVTFVMPEDGVYDETVCALGTVNEGQTFIVDVNKNGTTLYTTQTRRPTIADGADPAVSTQTATADVVALSTGDRITFAVDQIGSEAAGSDLTVQFKYKAYAV